DRGAEAGVRLRGPLHHARPVAAARVRRPDRDHVRGRGRRVRAREATVREPAAPVHGRADEVVPAADGAARAHDRDPRRAAEPREPAERLPLQPALPALSSRGRGAARAPDDGAAGPASARARPPRRLPPLRRIRVSAPAQLETLEVHGLTKHFPVSGGRLLARRGHVHAVDDVDFVLRPGTITALVGESGSGKSTVTRILARLYEPTAGTVVFAGSDVTRKTRRRDLLHYRSRVQMIFQDPFGSLNPVKTVRHHVERPLRIHKIVPS